MGLAKGNKSDEEIFLSQISRLMSIRIMNETWNYDSEDEFFAYYRKYKPDNDQNYFHYKRSPFFVSGELKIESASGTDSIVSVQFYGYADNRSIIERVFDVFEKDTQESRLPYELTVKPKIFIGHGRDSLWKDLKDHLQDNHSYEVLHYEAGSRAGHAIRVILEEMLSKSSFAILVMTAEDQTIEGQFRARQNVVHENGFFQGRIVFNRAVILLEAGAEEFSNIHGIEQIKFSKGNIKEAYGEVLATIKREFY